MAFRALRRVSTAPLPKVGGPAWELHTRLEQGQGVAGVYGGSHAVYHAVAEARKGRRLGRLAGPAHADQGQTVPEWHVPAFEAHLRNEATRANWDSIVSLDPYGLWATRPTISATMASMEIPEILPRLHVDGRVVNPDRSINCIKVAIDPVWDIPRLAKRLSCQEEELRDALARWTQIDALKDPRATQIYLPSIGGTTVYLFGDVSAIIDPDRPVATRPHDECSGSDTFGTDICTCRPYLVYAIEAAVETAQRNGCGIIAYFRKEGRALGEVTKFRVYNSRRYQEGGDRSETYFKMTEQIAGIVDARAQEIMPDIYHFLGVSTIDSLHSMSKDKYNAITGAGNIQVLSRVSLPEEMVPKNAQVEIRAKISSGYNAFQPKPGGESDDLDRRKVFTLETIRERCKAIADIGMEGKLEHFIVRPEKLDFVVGKVINTMRTNYPDLDIPMHSRLRHFETGSVDRIAELSHRWKRFNVDALEQTRRTIDLTVASVLLDAGAGPAWKYVDHRSGGLTLKRSEGLAVASLDMFRNGLFSSDAREPHRADSAALRKISAANLEMCFQVREDNPIVGLNGRLHILHRLAKSLENNPVIFGNSQGVFRPGNLVDYVLHQSHSDARFSIRLLWTSLMDGLLETFPDYSGLGVGDAYRHPALTRPGDNNPYHDVVPFHKLAQWLAYSLVEPLQSLGIHFVDTWLLNGLPEYRNGGLFIDTGVLEPRDPGYVYGSPLRVDDPAVVEWRALTVALLEETAVDIWDRLGTTERALTMAQILEGGTWRAGRELAYEKRPSGDPPILLDSAGDVF